MEEEDLYNTAKKLEAAIKRIKDSKRIIEANKEKLLEFTNHCLADGVGKNKMSRYLCDLVHIAEWLCKPFAEATKQDIEGLMVILQEYKGDNTGRLYSESTKRGYKIIIRKFYKWLRKTKVYPDEVEWIKTAIKENHKKLPEEMLVEEEVKRMIESCTCARDRALIAVLYDSGCRVGELLNLRIKNIEMVEYGIKASLRGKTGMRKILLIASVPYLVEWINEHPSKDADSYLWVKRNNKRISHGRTKDIIQRAADVAGVTKKVNPHAFRHARATFYASRLREREMMEYFGWSKSDTVGVYVHLNGEAVDRAILRSNGIIKIEEQDSKVLMPKVCERCKHSNVATAIFCEKCSLALDEKTRQELKQKDLERQQADEIMNQLIKDPEIQELIKKKLATP